MQIWSRKIKSQKSRQNWIWEGLGLHLGGVWDALGRLLGAPGPLLVAFWAFKIEFFSSIAPRWSPRGLLDRFGVDLGRFWEGFGRVLGGFWVNLGVDFEKNWGRIWRQPYTALHSPTQLYTALLSPTQPCTALSSPTQPYTALHRPAQP